MLWLHHTRWIVRTSWHLDVFQVKNAMPNAPWYALVSPVVEWSTGHCLEIIYLFSLSIVVYDPIICFFAWAVSLWQAGPQVLVGCEPCPSSPSWPCGMISSIWCRRRDINGSRLLKEKLAGMWWMLQWTKFSRDDWYTMSNSNLVEVSFTCAVSK